MKTSKKAMTAAAALLFALCAFPMMGMAQRWGVASPGMTLNPSCWTGAYGGVTNSSCSTTEGIYFYPATDDDNYSPSVHVSVYNPSSTSVVSCTAVGASVSSGVLQTYGGTYTNGIGSGYTTVNIPSVYVPSGGAMYIRCNVPPNGKVMNFSYDES